VANIPSYLVPLHIKWYQAAEACHQADISYIEKYPYRILTVPKTNSLNGRMQAENWVSIAAALLSNRSYSFIAKNISSSIGRLAAGYLIQDANKAVREMTRPFVNWFALFDDEPLLRTQQEQHEHYLVQAQEKRSFLQKNLSQKSQSISLNFFEILTSKKDYPGVSLGFVQESDQLPANEVERTLFLERWVTRWNFFKVTEEIRAAETDHTVKAVTCLTTPLSKLQIVAGFVALIALSSFYTYARLSIDKRILGISSNILRTIAYLVSTIALTLVYTSSVNKVRAMTGQDQLMQISEQEKKIRGRLIELDDWVGYFEWCQKQLSDSKNSSLDAAYKEAKTALEDLQVKQEAFKTFKASLGFLSSTVFTIAPDRSFLMEWFGFMASPRRLTL